MCPFLNLEDLLQKLSDKLIEMCVQGFFFMEVVYNSGSGAVGEDGMERRQILGLPGSQTLCCGVGCL